MIRVPNDDDSEGADDPDFKKFRKFVFLSGRKFVQRSGPSVRPAPARPSRRPWQLGAS